MIVLSDNDRIMNASSFPCGWLLLVVAAAVALVSCLYGVASPLLVAHAWMTTTTRIPASRFGRFEGPLPRSSSTTALLGIEKKQPNAGEPKQAAPTTVVTNENYALAESQIIFAQYCHKIRDAVASQQGVATTSGTNVFLHVPTAHDPQDRTIMRPNFDTLYSLRLSICPPRKSVPQHWCCRRNRLPTRRRPRRVRNAINQPS